MNHRTVVVSGAILALGFSVSSHAGEASAEGAESPGILQVFGCTLNDGKTMDNVWTQAEKFRQQVSGMSEITSDPNFGAFLWTPFRAATPYDFVWGVPGTDLTTLGDGFEAYYQSGTGQTLDAEFLELADCDSAIVFVEQMIEGQLSTGEDREPDALVETFGCTLNDGKTLEDVRSAGSFAREQMDKIDSEDVDQYQGFLWTPYRGGSGDSDFAWVGTYPGFKSWAAGEKAYMEAPEGQEVEARFNELGDCETAIWTGYWVMTPENVKQAMSEGQSGGHSGDG